MDVGTIYYCGVEEFQLDWKRKVMLLETEKIFCIHIYDKRLIFTVSLRIIKVGLYIKPRSQRVVGGDSYGRSPLCC